MCLISLRAGSGAQKSRLVGQQIVVADAGGGWRALLGALPPGGPLRLTATLVGGATVAVEGVLVGLVWLVRACPARPSLLQAGFATCSCTPLPPPRRHCDEHRQ